MEKQNITGIFNTYLSVCSSNHGGCNSYKYALPEKSEKMDMLKHQNRSFRVDFMFLEKHYVLHCDMKKLKSQIRRKYNQMLRFDEVAEQRISKMTNIKKWPIPLENY